MEKNTNSEVLFLQKYIEQLENEINLMFPWGEIDLFEIVLSRNNGIDLRFWTMESKKFHKELQRSMDPTIPHWMSLYNARPISESGSLCYFTTRTAQDVEINIPFASPAKMVPSPVSTLIMLQTRAKDMLKSIKPTKK